MKKFFGRLLFVRAFFTIVRDPTRTEQIFEMSTQFRKRAQEGPLLNITREFVASRPGFLSLYESRYNPKIPALADLDKLPEGTFGKAFARHMLDHGLEINFFPTVEGETTLEYMINRSRQIHDFWHVLTGFSTSVPDELGLQAFTFMQLQAAFPLIIVIAGILHILSQRPSAFPETIEKLAQGLQMGRQAKWIIGVRLEDHFGDRLEDLRRELGIVVQPSEFHFADSKAV